MTVTAEHEVTSTPEPEEFEVISDSPPRDCYHIRPRDVRVRGDMAGRFGKAEVETTAGHLVLFFQERGGWVPFTISELSDFYRAKGWNPNLMFFGLSGHWYDDSTMKEFLGQPWTPSRPYLVADPNGLYRVTDRFIEACMRP